MKFGLLCPPGTGHLNNFAALGYELRQRGHQVTLFGLPDVESYAVAADLDFYPFGADKFPLGSVVRSQKRLRRIKRHSCFTTDDRTVSPGNRNSFKRYSCCYYSKQTLNFY